MAGLDLEGWLRGGSKPHYAILAGILMIAVALRFGGLQERGLVYWDEGLYALESLFLLQVPGNLPEVIRHYDLASSSPYFPARPPLRAKPTHDLILALAMAAFGKVDYVLLGASAFLGSATVLVTYLVARSMFTPATGLVAALVLAVLPYHVYYSRDARAEVDAALMVLAGLWAYHRAWTARQRRIGWRAASGFLLGLAFTTQTRVYMLLPALAVQEALSLLRCRRGTSPVRWLREVAVMGLAGLLPLAGWEAAYRLLLRYAKSQGETALPFRLYSQQIQFWQPSMIGQSAWPDGSDLGFYPLAFAELGSLLVLVLAALGSAIVLMQARRHHTGTMLGVLFLAPMVCYSLLSLKAPRYVVVLLPLAAILAAVGIAGLWRVGGRRTVRAVLAAALAAAMLLEGMDGWSSALASSGSRAATEWLAARGQPRYLAFQQPVYQFYAGGSAIVGEAALRPEGLAQQCRTGARYLVMDDQAYLGAGLVADWPWPTSLEKRAPALFTVSDPSKDGPMFYLEHAEWLRRDGQTMRAAWESVRRVRGPATIRVYEVAELVDCGRGVGREADARAAGSVIM